MVRYVIKAAGMVLAVVLAEPPAAQRIKAGLLSCDVSPGIGLIITSEKQVSCAFKADQPGRQEDYNGSITKYGLDLGVTGGGMMVWAVFTSAGLFVNRHNSRTARSSHCGKDCPIEPLRQEQYLNPK